MGHPIVLALVAALLFGVWPLLARQASLPALWVAAGISAGTALVTIVALAFGAVGQTMPGGRPIAVLLVGGALNGVGMIAYGRLLGDDRLDISTYVPIVLASTVMVSAVGGAVLFGETFPVRKLAGIGAVVLAIWLLG